jgi:hypothetical protein
VPSLASSKSFPGWAAPEGSSRWPRKCRQSCQPPGSKPSFPANLLAIGWVSELFVLHSSCSGRPIGLVLLPYKARLKIERSHRRWVLQAAMSFSHALKLRPIFRASARRACGRAFRPQIPRRGYASQHGSGAASGDAPWYGCPPLQPNPRTEG